MNKANRLSICIDRIDGPLYQPSYVRAPAPTHHELALEWNKRWQVGQELLIRFLNGEERLRRRVEEHAREWTRHANILFDFGPHEHADIRISFEGVGYWSLVGTDAAREPAGAPTMRLGGFTAGMDDAEMRRIVLHELGHALGCIHEHQSPAAGIPWDREQVYAYYDEHHGWGRALVDRNVLGRYDAAMLRFSQHDPRSIMQYPVPRELTDGVFEIGWNSDLSDEDKRFIGLLYPPEGEGA